MGYLLLVEYRVNVPFIEANDLDNYVNIELVSVFGRYGKVDRLDYYFLNLIDKAGLYREFCQLIRVQELGDIGVCNSVSAVGPGDGILQLLLEIIVSDILPVAGSIVLNRGVANGQILRLLELEMQCGACCAEVSDIVGICAAVSEAVRHEEVEGNNNCTCIGAAVEKVIGCTTGSSCVGGGEILISVVVVGIAYAIILIVGESSPFAFCNRAYAFSEAGGCEECGSLVSNNGLVGEQR